MSSKIRWSPPRYQVGDVLYFHSALPYYKNVMIEKGDRGVISWTGEEYAGWTAYVVTLLDGKEVGVIGMELEGCAQRE